MFASMINGYISIEHLKSHHKGWYKELKEQGLQGLQQARLNVCYRDLVVGEYYADLLVEDQIICELKAVDSITRQHEVQLVNYLAATGIDTGLLINFGKSVSIRRKFRNYQEAVNLEKLC